MVSPRFCRMPLVLLAVASLPFLAPNAAATTVWPFNADLEGWTPGFPPYGGELAYLPADGNPGGCAAVYDDCAGCGRLPVIAPLVYPADLREYGSITYDFFLGQYALSHAALVITGSDGTVFQFTPSDAVATEVWVAHWAPLIASAWTRTEGTAGFASVLASVASLAVDFDVSINEHDRLEGKLDNFALVDGMQSACCDPVSGGCSIRTYPDCAAAGGIFIPYLPTCSPDPCALAACCDPQTNECRLLPAGACAEWGGYFISSSTTCAPDPCVQGACCDFVSGFCQVLRGGECWAFGYELATEFQSCEPNPCVPSVCCDTQSGTCMVVTYDECTAVGGYFIPGTTTCEPNPCGPGACCDPATHACTVTRLWECAAVGGTFIGWPFCDPNPCDPGACCDVATGACTFGPAYECWQAGGDFQTQWQSCSPSPCVPIACCIPPERECELMLWGDCEALGGYYSLSFPACDPSPCLPDPARCSVAPWDAYGKAFMSPGSQSTVDQVTVTLTTLLGVPVSGAEVSIELWDCADKPICVDSPVDGLRAVTDFMGRAVLNPQVGGCAVCSVVVRAAGVVIRTYPSLASPDWDGVQADGRVDSADQGWFSAAGSQEPCADYDGDGLKTTVELTMFATAYNRDANTNPLCIRIDVEEPSTPIEGGFLLKVAANPSSDRLHILFSLAEEGTVRIEVFDAAGRLVRELLNGRRPAGPGEVGWDGSGTDPVARAGVYFIRMSGPGGVRSQKAVLLR